MNQGDTPTHTPDTGVLLTLIVAPEFEDAIVDWLLMRGESGFTSAPCRGHGGTETHLSDAEQVAGHSRQVVFWIHLSRDDAETLMDALPRAFPRARIHFWVTPVLATGRVG